MFFDAFQLFWPSRRPKPAEKPRKACPGPLPGAQSLAGNSPGLLRACSGPPLACRGAPQRLPRVASGRPKPARELARTWPGLPQAAPVLPRSSGRPAQGHHGPAEELRKACPGPPMACSVRLDSSSLPQDGCSNSQIRSATSDNAEKASEHARVHSRRPSPMFRPVAASRSGTRWAQRGPQMVPRCRKTK